MEAMLYALVLTGFVITGFRLHQLSRRLAALEKDRADPKAG